MIPPILSSVVSVSIDNSKELPPGVYTGSVEILGGALIGVVGIVFPPAYGLSIALVGDGVRRLLDSVEQIDKERREDGRFMPTPSPSSAGFDF